MSTTAAAATGSSSFSRPEDRFNQKLSELGERQGKLRSNIKELASKVVVASEGRVPEYTEERTSATGTGGMPEPFFEEGSGGGAPEEDYYAYEEEAEETTITTAVFEMEEEQQGEDQGLAGRSGSEEVGRRAIELLIDASQSVEEEGAVEQQPGVVKKRVAPLVRPSARTGSRIGESTSHFHMIKRPKRTLLVSASTSDVKADLYALSFILKYHFFIPFYDNLVLIHAVETGTGECVVGNEVVVEPGSTRLDWRASNSLGGSSEPFSAQKSNSAVIGGIPESLKRCFLAIDDYYRFLMVEKGLEFGVTVMNGDPPHILISEAEAMETWEQQPQPPVVTKSKGRQRDPAVKETEPEPESNTFAPTTTMTTSSSSTSLLDTMNTWIVVGTRKSSHLARALSFTVHDHLIRHCKYPVLIIREPSLTTIPTSSLSKSGVAVPLTEEKH